MGDFMQDREANFFTQVIWVRKILQQRFGEYGNLIRQQRRIEVRSFGQRHAFIDSIKRVVPGIEPFGAQQFIRGPFIDNDLDIMQLVTKLARQFIDNLRDRYFNLVVIQRF